MLARALLARPCSARLAVLIPMGFLWCIGNYGFLGDAATLFSAHGQDSGNSILYLGIGAIGYPLGAVIMSALADRVERKLLIVGSTVIWLIGMIIIGTRASEAVLTIGSFLASLALGLSLQIAYTYTAESFPTQAGPGPADSPCPTASATVAERSGPAAPDRRLGVVLRGFRRDRGHWPAGRADRPVRPEVQRTAAGRRSPADDGHPSSLPRHPRHPGVRAGWRGRAAVLSPPW
jgi:hypothetical protein